MRDALKRRYAVIEMSDTLNAALSAGLCGGCRFMRQITSDRGSTFYQCQLSATDPEFPKYPRLPVIRCRGYERKSPHPGSADR